MRKLLTILVTLTIFAGHSTVALANENASSLYFKGSLTINQYKQDSIERDIDKQIELLESLLDVSVPKEIPIYLYPEFSSASSKGFDGKRIHAIAIADYKESTGKTNPIFSQLLNATWPSCPNGTSQIITRFLTYRYLNIDPISFSTELRYTFPLNNLTGDPDFGNDIRPLPESLVTITCARLNQVEEEKGITTLKMLLYSMKYGIADAVQRILDIDFVTFIRSLRYQTTTDQEPNTIIPTGDLKEQLHEIKDLRASVWSNLPHFKGDADHRIRTEPESYLGQASIEMAMGEPTPVIDDTLSDARLFFGKRNKVFNDWWIFTGIATLILLLLMAMSILGGLKFNKDNLT